MALDFVGDAVVVTLLDLGLATAIGARGFPGNASSDPAARAFLEATRRRNHAHIAPEYFLGGPAQPSADAFSLGALVRSCARIKDEAVRQLLRRARSHDPDARPALAEFARAFERLGQHARSPAPTSRREEAAPAEVTEEPSPEEPKSPRLQE